MTQADSGGYIPLTEETQPGLDYTYRDVLGNAVNYGITVEKLTINNHMDTTFAAKLLENRTPNINIGNDTGKQGSPILIGGWSSNSQDLRIEEHGPESCIVYLTPDADSHITFQNLVNPQKIVESADEIGAWVDGMIDHAKQVSQILLAQPTYTFMQQNSDGSWYFDQNATTLDISKLEDGTYYINGDEFFKKNNITIKKKSTQTIVFNFEGNSPHISQYNITHTDTNKTVGTGNSSGEMFEFASTLIFNMPNATSFNPGNVSGVFIAPNADVTTPNGTGWIVAKSYANSGEWHFVHQELTEPLPVTVAAKKTLDGETPDEHTEFSFKVEEWTNGQWVEEQTVHNFLGDILFRETFSKAGTYYYRVSELNEGGAYQYDTTQYIVEIKVTAIQENILQAEQTIYKTGDMGELSDGTKVTEILFQNTTGQPGYVLPETGGAGTILFTAGGAALLALTGLMYMISRRKEEGAP